MRSIYPFNQKSISFSLKPPVGLSLRLIANGTTFNGSDEGEGDKNDFYMRPPTMPEWPVQGWTKPRSFSAQ